MKTLKKIYLVSFLIGSMLTSALLTQGQIAKKKLNDCDCNTNQFYISAGSDVTICKDNVFVTQGVNTLKGKTYWKTTGDGTFDHPYSLNAIYTPGKQDFTNGNVMLYLYLLPNGNSDNKPVFDTMILHFGNCLSGNETNER